MTSGVIESLSTLSLETNTEDTETSLADTNTIHGSLDGDTSTEGSISPDLLITNEVSQPLHQPTGHSAAAVASLNANAPAFTSISSMTPVLITKNIEIGNERWKPTATIVEENINSVPIHDLPQPYIAPDGLYYWPADMINGFPPQPVLIESLPNGTATVIQADHDSQQAFTQQNALVRPDIITQVSAPPPTPPINNVVIPPSTKDLTPDELKRSIQNQFEYYFSRENLANDQYLNSQMDSDQYVPISTVAKFNQVRKLTSDIDLIVDALRESPYVQLDETEQKVRANMKRCIVILREIPEVTPIEDVKALFASPNCPKWTSFEYAYNDNWYVTFECEDDAKKAYRYLREEVQSFQGRPLMARIKAKTLLSRTVYLPKNAASATGSTTTNTSPPADNVTSQFSTTGGVPAFTVSHPQQIFSPNFQPFYNTAPVNGNPGILPAGAQWISTTTRFIPPEIRPKNNYNKYNNYQGNKQLNGQRPYFPGSKPRFRNNYNNPNKVPFHERNGNVDYNSEDRPSNVPTNRRNNNPSGHNHQNVHNTNVNSNYRGRNSEDPRFVRHSGPRKDWNRNSSEEGPRFQRLRERRGKDDTGGSSSTSSTKDEKMSSHSKNPSSKHDKSSISSNEGSEDSSNAPQINGDLNLDLALDFPALPSPNSPNETGSNGSANRSASSLKELAANVLSEVESNKEKPMTTSPADMSELLTTAEVFEPAATEPAQTTTTNANENAPLITTVVSTDNGIPKMLSYAQMAQKPNSNKENFVNDIDTAKDISDAVAASDPKKSSNNKTENGKNGQSANGKQNRKPGSKNSPRSQRRKSNGQDKSAEVEQMSVSSNLTNTVMKETYASKFGSSSDSSRTGNSPSRPKTQPTTNTNSINKQNPPSTNNKNNSGLPALRPLMSQVINPPVSKMDEINGLELQQQQPISFSDTVKKQSSIEPSTPTSPRSIDLNSVSSPPSSNTVSQPPETSSTIEAPKEKS
ncbi:la-related protein 4-like isoform X2 [Clytia hemisphaerica]|uniref:HTH La-type RNA-binding domain-containing protein n=1 Tax=Clytia hemisphaerica TaxID=252671 RepID=A0A7M5X042_9CNID|eukprot:TCONS_00000399-protein